MGTHSVTVKSYGEMYPKVVPKWGLPLELGTMPPVTDTFNAAVAAVLNDIYVADGSQLTRVTREAGISKMSLGRYLSGERHIRVVDLRKIAAALNAEVGDILTEAERRLK